MGRFEAVDFSYSGLIYLDRKERVLQVVKLDEKSPTARIHLRLSSDLDLSAAGTWTWLNEGNLFVQRSDSKSCSGCGLSIRSSLSGKELLKLDVGSKVLEVHVTDFGDGLYVLTEDGQVLKTKVSRI